MNLIMSHQTFQHQYPHRFPPPLTPTSPLDFTDRIPFKEIELLNETLGSGSFGTVFKGRWRGRMVAVKQYKTREEIDSFLVEVKQLSCVKHPNIVTLYGASTLADNAYLIMEYAEGGSLNHLLHECKQQQYDLRHACSWAMQTARGVAYLHGIRPKPIMHRDLKPANLLLFARGKIIKICDFGTACTVKTQMTNNTGSASYMAPEVFATSSYLESGDVYSWSIIFWEILARSHPYSQQYSNPYQILWRVKQEGIRPNEIENCPAIIWNLITKSWNKSPKKRPTMREVAEEMEFIFSLTDTKSTRATPNHDDNTVQHHRMPKQSPSQQQHRQISSNSSPSDQIRSEDEDKANRNQPPDTISLVSMINQQATSPMNCKKITNCVERERYTHSRALLHQVQTLKLRAKELERCDKRFSTWDLIEEIVELKRDMDYKCLELDFYNSAHCPNRRHS